VVDAAAGRNLFSRDSSAVLSPLQDAQESRLNVFTLPRSVPPCDGGRTGTRATSSATLRHRDLAQPDSNTNAARMSIHSALECRSK
jgi:hypothetical protein